MSARSSQSTGFSKELLADFAEVCGFAEACCAQTTDAVPKPVRAIAASASLLRIAAIFCLKTILRSSEAELANLPFGELQIDCTVFRFVHSELAAIDSRHTQMLAFRYFHAEELILFCRPCGINKMVPRPVHCDLGIAANVHPCQRTLSPLLRKRRQQVHFNAIRIPSRLDQCLQHAIRRAQVAVNLEQSRGMRIHEVGKC